MFLKTVSPVRGVTLEEASAVLGSGFLIMCSLSGLTVLEVSPARMIMVFGVLFFAAIYKEAGGAVGGMLAFLLIAISSDTGAVSASFAVGGLLAGAFSRLGRRAVPPAFFASFLTAYMFSGGGSEKYFFDYRGRFAVRGVYVFAEQPVYKGGGLSFAEGLGGERVGGKR